MQGRPPGIRELVGGEKDVKKFFCFTEIGYIKLYIKKHKMKKALLTLSFTLLVMVSYGQKMTKIDSLMQKEYSKIQALIDSSKAKGHIVEKEPTKGTLLWYTTNYGIWNEYDKHTTENTLTQIYTWYNAKGKFRLVTFVDNKFYYEYTSEPIN